MTDKVVKEIQALERTHGSADFMVVYDDRSAQKITFTGEELQHWRLDPHLFTRMLWIKMHDEGKELHEALSEMERELTSEDWQVNKMFDQMRAELENETKGVDNGKPTRRPKRATTKPAKSSSE
jgi:hypothetical protein